LLLDKFLSSNWFCAQDSFDIAADGYWMQSFVVFNGFLYAMEQQGFGDEKVE